MTTELSLENCHNTPYLHLLTIPVSKLVLFFFLKKTIMEDNDKKHSYQGSTVNVYVGLCRSKAKKSQILLKYPGSSQPNFKDYSQF